MSGIETYRLRNTSAVPKLCVVENITSRFISDHAVTIAAKAEPGATILVCYGMKHDDDDLKNCKLCFKGFDRVVYTNIDSGQIIYNDKIYNLTGSIQGDSSPNTIGDEEIYAAALALTKNDYTIYSYIGDVKAWLEKQGIP
jgi:hypothetical protein